MDTDNKMTNAYMQPNGKDNIQPNPKQKREVNLILIFIMCIVVIGGVAFAVLQIRNNSLKEQKSNDNKVAKETTVKETAEETTMRNPIYEQGTIDGNIYTSKFLNLKFECPSDCTMKSEFDNEKIEDMLNLDDNDVYKSGKEISIEELKVSDTTGENNFNIIVGVGGYPNLNSYTKYLKKQMEEIYKDYNVKCDIKVGSDADLGNEKYETLETKMKFSDYKFTLNQWQYIRQIGKYFVIISFTGDKDKFTGNFSPLE